MKFFDIYFTNKITCLTLYFFLASQGGFYLLAFGKVLKVLSTDSFLQIRKATERFIETPLKILYPVTNLCLMIWVVLAEKVSGLSFTFLVSSLMLLLVDLLLAIKISIPLNKRIAKLESSFTDEAFTAKKRWIKFIVIRGYLSATGFIFLLIHLLI